MQSILGNIVNFKKVFKAAGQQTVLCELLQAFWQASKILFSKVRCKFQEEFHSSGVADSVFIH